MDNRSQCTKLVLGFDPIEDEADVNYATFSFVKVSQLTLLSVIIM